MDENKRMKTPNEIYKPSIPKNIGDKLAELIADNTIEINIKAIH